MNEDILTVNSVKTYNKIVKSLLNKTALEVFLGVTNHLMERKPESNYLMDLVGLITSKAMSDINAVNMNMMQLQEFYNSIIMTIDEVYENIDLVEAVVESMLACESEARNLIIIQEQSENIVNTIAVEYGFMDILENTVGYDDLTQKIQIILKHEEVLIGSFFQALEINMMSKKGAQPEEFFDLAMGLLMTTFYFNENRKQGFRKIQKPVSLTSLVKPYLKTKLVVLFSLGREALEDKSFSYKKLGLNKRNKKQLISLAANMQLYFHESDEDENHLAFFAVIHAWKALSELEIVESKDLFLGLLRFFYAEIEDDDWMMSMFDALIEPFIDDMAQESEAILSDEHENEWVRDHAVSILLKLRQKNILSLKKLNTIFKNLLQNNKNALVNSSVISVCKDLELKEHYLAIVSLFENDLVDLDMDGDLEDVEIAFGIRKERTTRRGNSYTKTHGFPDEQESLPKKEKPGRNSPCPCGSGKKYKKCCG